jgi:tetratricopeptide (TPR) repeat protein
MKFDRFFAPTFFVTICLIAPSPVLALPASEVAQIAKAISVKIENPALSSHGSGTLIQQDSKTYYVLTAFHVLSQPGKYTLIAPDGEKYPIEYKTMKYKSGTDLAIFQIKSDKKYQIAKIGNSDKVKEGNISYVAGFPKPTSAFPISAFRFLEGKITANASRPVDEGYQIVYSNNTLGGMSGGAVLNEQGELIAVHGRAETIADISKGSPKPVSTGNNLGIAINTFLRLALMDVGVKAPEVQVTTKPKPDDLYLQAVAKYNKGDYRGAIATYSKIIQVNPKNAKAYINRGSAKAQIKDYKGAIADFDKALALNPKEALAYANRGAVRSAQGDKKGEVADLTKAIDLAPQLAIAYNNRGVANYESGNKAQAEADLDKAIELDPNSALAYNNRGMLRYFMKRYPAALADFSEAIRINPEYALAYNNRGLAIYSLGNKLGSTSEFGKAIAIDPQLAIAYYNRGTILSEIGQRPRAVADFMKALGLDPQLSQVLGENTAKVGNDFTQGITFAPNLAQAYTNRGLARDRLGNQPGALIDYSRAISIDLRYSDAYYRRGILHYELGQIDAALRDWQQAAILDFNLPEAELFRAVALDRQGKTAEALQLAQRAIPRLRTQLGGNLSQQKGEWGDRLFQDITKFLDKPQFKRLLP